MTGKDCGVPELPGLRGKADAESEGNLHKNCEHPEQKVKSVYFCRMNMFNCNKKTGKKLAISKGENFTRKVYNKDINHGAARPQGKMCSVAPREISKEKMIMKEFQYTVKDACGIHARPAGLLVKTVKGFASTATLEKSGKSCDMRKLMALMGMGVKQGETVTIKVEGDDEEAAAEAIQKFLSENV